MRKLAQKKKKGFTLIELIIVLAILAIIAAIAIPNFAAVRKNAAYKIDIQSADSIKRTVATYVSDGTVKLDATNSITFDVGANGTITSPAHFDATTGAAAQTALTAALKDTKAPQSTDKFNITIASTGEPTRVPGTAASTVYHVTITTAGDVYVATGTIS